MANAFTNHLNVMDGRNVMIGAMRPQRYVEPTVRMWKVEGLPAQMANALRIGGNAMEEMTVRMAVMRLQRHVEPTVRR